VPGNRESNMSTVNAYEVQQDELVHNQFANHEHLTPAASKKCLDEHCEYLKIGSLLHIFSKQYHPGGQVIVVCGEPVSSSKIN